MSNPENPILRVLMRSILLIALFSWSGCSPQPNPVDPTALVLIPGVGISNVVELGMTTKQVKGKVQGVEIEESSVKVPYSLSFLGKQITFPKPFSTPAGYICTVPGLGIHWINIDEEEPIFQITVNVAAESAVFPEREVPFQGKLGNYHSFTDATRLTREDILRHFGAPSNHIVIPNARHLECFRTQGPNGQSVHLQWTDMSSFVYPSHGISFDIKSNVVQSITVKAKR